MVDNLPTSTGEFAGFLVAINSSTPPGDEEFHQFVT